MRVSFVCTLLIFFGQTSWANPWTHIEFGAGNYGAKGGEGYENMVRGPNQYLRLYQQVEQLIKAHGEEGILYINDLNNAYARFAAWKVLEYCKGHGHDKIEVRVLSGDFTTMALPLVDSAALRNPEPQLFKKRERIAAVLQRLANCSRSGLQVTTHVHEEFDQVVKKGLSLTATKKASSYLTPDGNDFLDDGAVPINKLYSIAPNELAGSAEKLGYLATEATCSRVINPMARSSGMRPITKKRRTETQ